MNSRILLTGKGGQVGSALQGLLPRLGETIAFGRAELDLADPDAIRRVVRDVRPGLIVNAAAYTAVDRAETEQAAAWAANAAAPGVLAEAAKQVGAALVHYSTDYVFDGSKTSPYEEDDAIRPMNAYGKTKFAGEQAIRDAALPHLILRTAWVYAVRGKNFLLTILRLATQNQELRVVADQMGAPTWSGMIAAATVRILEQASPAGAAFARMPEFSGTYHLTASGRTSWCGFAQAILEECSDPERVGPWLASVTGGRPLIAQRVNAITTAEYPTPARRPAYAVLSNERLRRTFGFELPEWRAQLRMALRDLPPDGASDLLRAVR